MTNTTNIQPKSNNLFKNFTERVILGSRWILLPFYFGLIFAQILYCSKFCQELYHLTLHFWNLTENELMLAILALIDIVMVGNLIKMIISGSYQSFVSKIAGDHSEKVGSGLLKVKMGTSLVGISSIHLLRTFMDGTESDRAVIIKCAIHVIFLISSMGLAYIDSITHKEASSSTTH